MQPEIEGKEPSKHNMHSFTLHDAQPDGHS